MERYAIDKRSYVALYAETQLTRFDFSSVHDALVFTFYIFQE